MSQPENPSQINNVFNNEGFTAENDQETPKKKRRRRPNQSNEEEINEVEDRTDDRARKHHRRRKRPSNSGIAVTPSNSNSLAAHLEDLQDDIEIRTLEDDLTNIDQLTTSRGKAAVIQGGGDTIYVEGSRKFRAENQEKYMNNKLKESQKMSERLNINEDRFDNDLLQCAATITERFRIIATFLHGLFAGLVLMYTVFSLIAVSLISNQSYLTGIFSLYQFIQSPFSIVNYLIFIIIGVSIMDRCDLAQPSRKCNQNQGGVVLASILIFIAFILCNSLYYFNSYFNIFATNSTYITVLASKFPTWAIIDAVKSALVIVSWFVIALLPVYDRYLENLRFDMKQDSLDNGFFERR